MIDFIIKKLPYDLTSNVDLALVGNPPKLTDVTPCKPDLDAALPNFSVVAVCDQALADGNWDPTVRTLCPKG